MLRLRCVRLLTPLVFLAIPSWAAAETLFTITDLATLGGNQSFARAINNHGEVTGNASTNAGSNFPLNAARWSPGSYQSPTNLGVLPGADSNFSRGFAINDSGTVVGESSNNTSRAFMFRDGTLSDLGTLGGASAVAHGINAHHQVVGISSTGTQSNAFLWEDGTMTNLGTLGGNFSRAWAINDGGQVVGVSRVTGNTTSHAFLHDGNSMIDLGSLGGADRFSEALAINASGLIVGRSSLDIGGNSVQRATLWDGVGSMIDLGTLTNPDDGNPFRFSRANDINDLGVVVGTASRFEGFSGRAFIWDATHGIRDLNSLIAPGSGWLLTSAEGINNRGQIVGFGTFEGQTRAFVLTVIPEPSSVILAAIGGISLAAVEIARRRRSSSIHRVDHP
ncbi:DUF3466 family protein [Tautonia rosea]|uniref:DUF3466 family protein n=1 Tax=Tautonia rosea TaxID=2728037 RepID=UPI0014730260|nr:DUF3466 family protein [Tautonia rosea]